MSYSIRTDFSRGQLITQHLRGAPERVAFLSASEKNHALEVQDHLLLPDEDLEAGPWCVQLSDAAQQRVLQWAATTSGWLIEAHSHLGIAGDPAQFSPIDLDGLHEWVPHVRWRLHGRPYAATVFAPTTVDGLAWNGARGDQPLPLKAWEFGMSTVPMTQRSIRALGGPR
jgi:hypothetical protein